MIMKFILFLLLLISTCSLAQKPTVSAGSIVHIENFKSTFVKPRNIDVWLPDNYSRKNKYPVLYMHDGQMLFDSSFNWNKQEWRVDETVSSMINSGKIYPFIIVGIWNTGSSRHTEYCPQKPFESLSSSYKDSLIEYARRNNGQTVFSGKVVADNYLKFIVKELKPYIDSAFSTLKVPANTYIAGSSMGGLISLYALCEYPEVFGSAACMSTHWPVIFTNQNNPFPEAIFDYLQKKLPIQKNHRFYFDYGTATLDTLYEPYQTRVNAIMNAKGYSSRNWITVPYPGENHSEAAWARRFDKVLSFLFNR